MDHEFDLSVCIERLYTDDPIPERIRQVAEVGVPAFEFWNWRSKDLEEIERVADDAGVDLAAFTGVTPTLTDPDNYDQAVADLTEALEIAGRLDVPNVIVTVGDAQPDLDRSTQHDAIVDVLDAVSEVAQAADTTIVLEPLNAVVDNPEYYLTSSYEGYDIVRKVDNPAVRLLFDIYHQQLTEGNLINNITEHIDLIGHIHVLDVPSKQEPGTGEINYANVLAAIAETGYDRYVGLEYHPSGNDDDAVRATQRLLQ